jgi:hypothetical protein
LSLLLFAYPDNPFVVFSCIVSSLKRKSPSLTAPRSFPILYETQTQLLLFDEIEFQAFPFDLPFLDGLSLYASLS